MTYLAAREESENAKTPLEPKLKRGFAIFPNEDKKLAIPTFALVGTIIGTESLTTVFGMGTGISFRLWSPEIDTWTVKPHVPL